MSEKVYTECKAILDEIEAAHERGEYHNGELWMQVRDKVVRHGRNNSMGMDTMARATDLAVREREMRDAQG